MIRFCISGVYAGLKSALGFSSVEPAFGVAGDGRTALGVDAGGLSAPWGDAAGGGVAAVVLFFAPAATPIAYTDSATASSATSSAASDTPTVNRPRAGDADGPTGTDPGPAADPGPAGGTGPGAGPG